MFVKTDYKPELGAYTIKLSSILLHKMPAQHIVSTLEMITFRRRNMYKTKKYTLWSNFRFVFTPVWKEKRIKIISGTCRYNYACQLERIKGGKANVSSITGIICG